VGGLSGATAPGVGRALARRCRPAG
jgi:hypothetical protein